jgi:hypothetical protein
MTGNDQDKKQSTQKDKLPPLKKRGNQPQECRLLRIR